MRRNGRRYSQAQDKYKANNESADLEQIHLAGRGHFPLLKLVAVQMPRIVLGHRGYNGQRQDNDKNNDEGANQEKVQIVTSEHMSLLL
jgi:hypothetical protein